MSTIQQSKVKTLSDRAAQRSAQWADQAIKSRPQGQLSHADIDSATQGTHSPSYAAEGNPSTETFLFDDLQPVETSLTKTRRKRKTNPSKGTLRMEVHTVSATRDRTSARTQNPAEKAANRKVRASANRAATPNVMSAELPFATGAIQDDAGERKLHRRPDASPCRAKQMARRSSLAPHTTMNSTATDGVGTTPMGLESKAKPSHLKGTQNSHKTNTRFPMEWQDAFRASTLAVPTGIPITDEPCIEDINQLQPPTGLIQRVSQLLAKPEVGGYLVMGALIAGTFLV